MSEVLPRAMLNSVTIHGDGVAACCCARLLTNRGLPIHYSKSTRPNLPSLLISTSTQQLMADVFEDQHIFDGFPTIQKRVVLWRNQAAPVVLPHSGTAVPESALLQRLWARLAVGQDDVAESDSDWQIFSAKGASQGKVMHFGSRTAMAFSLDLSAKAAADECYVEALDAGWLFLLPGLNQQGSLLCVGDSAQALLGESRLVAEKIKTLPEVGQQFAAYPRILDPLCGPGWLACGTSALSFDPICGEGAGNAIREAILVSAALGFLATHSDAQPVLDHYSSRLLGGFLKHLLLCHDFYSAGPDCEWWSQELAALRDGINWAKGQLAAIVRPQGQQFRLVGFDLQYAL